MTSRGDKVAAKVADLPDWDFAKIEANIADAMRRKQGGPFHVLVATGAMNPVHRGHVAMLRKVANSPEWQERGGRVVGGFLSPSHDLYLRGKFGEGNFLPATKRAAMVRAALEGEPLFSLGLYEVRAEGRWPDFPEVATNLGDAVRERFVDVPVRVWYVCGEDHYTKCHLRRGVTKTIGCCVVARGGKRPVMKRANPDLVIGVVAEDETDDMSSTKVRMHLESLQNLCSEGPIDSLLGAVASDGTGDASSAAVRGHKDALRSLLPVGTLDLLLSRTQQEEGSQHL
uniref:Cytidyltransferase-like domain-containing protein n=1 Tax=Trieres chinensis TaxID=1514140 RepID=A0A7S1ZHL6_TRICV|mmetsp:Transcript_25630/g.52478  ORF Transcript_25630/g.52478 Transcript_25630/m.52478 type:complete len:285 (+) Transcript_25630:143-997(+)|eukprot:CAMPEP_0183323762 /NCGR_PEP_ID=MMETSP0160_2-20130417/75250_1 /TAXON_ID=2839 ORGANISM="Odontella Sinensis, Strain Grunow 1884" /NCGR_SAMPLE_ID=MMETSP0160_2 /ASSEMBLY_ACC=CAM_ASM_000250 /LENGTH=284 /DNA_ID=CAMNT_0025491191 /DNA_START=135 /DNA_END=989 /DNA_ORIENTATION=+